MLWTCQERTSGGLCLVVCGTVLGKKTGSWWRPPTRGLPEACSKIPSTDRAVWFSSARFFSRRRLVNSQLVKKKEQRNRKTVFFEVVLPSLAKKTSQGKWQPTHDAIDSVIATENTLNPSWVKHRRMQRCVVATPPSFFFFLFHYPLEQRGDHLHLCDIWPLTSVTGWCFFVLFCWNASKQSSKSGLLALWPGEREREREIDR